jgi:hypothetical protein
MAFHRSGVSEQPAAEFRDDGGHGAGGVPELNAFAHVGSERGEVG